MSGLDAHDIAQRPTDRTTRYPDAVGRILDKLRHPSLSNLIPAQPGIPRCAYFLASRLRGNDETERKSTSGTVS